MAIIYTDVRLISRQVEIPAKLYPIIVGYNGGEYTMDFSSDIVDPDYFLEIIPAYENELTEADIQDIKDFVDVVRTSKNDHRTDIITLCKGE